MANPFVVEDVLSRVQQLTEELSQTRREICNHIFTDEEPDDSSLYSRSSHSLEAMTRFKEALDDARHVVWLYLEAVAEHPVASVDRQRRLLTRANEILGALSHRPPLPMPDRPSGERSLMDRLLQLIDNRIEPARVVRPDVLPKNGC